MLAATLLVLVASAAPPAPDYRQAELTDADHHNIALLCESTHFSKSARLDCVKQETEKLRRQKQDLSDARDAEARTAKETAR